MDYDVLLMDHCMHNLVSLWTDEWTTCCSNGQLPNQWHISWFTFCDTLLHVSRVPLPPMEDE